MHLHGLLLDRLYRCDVDGLPEFVEVGSPTDDEVHALLQAINTRLMKMLKRRGVLVEDMGQTYLAEPDTDGEESRTLRPLQAPTRLRAARGGAAQRGGQTHSGFAWGLTMSWVLDEQRRVLRDSAQAFVDDRMPVVQLRALRDRADERGYDAACWRGFGEQGYAATQPDGGGWPLSGAKQLVVDGHVADALIVAAQAGEGVALLIVPRDVLGLKVERTVMVDARNASRVRLDGVRVGAEAQIGNPAQGPPVHETRARSARAAGDAAYLLERLAVDSSY
jgi:hypothetical protein